MYEKNKRRLCSRCDREVDKPYFFLCPNCRCHDWPHRLHPPPKKTRLYKPICQPLSGHIKSNPLLDDDKSSGSWQAHDVAACGDCGYLTADGRDTRCPYRNDKTGCERWRNEYMKDDEHVD